MQNTRLNNLVYAIAGQIGQWLRNPWRRLSLILISLLFGFFLGNAISTIAGQKGKWDFAAAGVVLLVTEAVNWYVYGSKRPNQANARESDANRANVPTRSFLTGILNSLKIGLTYSLFVEAFKLGS